LVLARGLSEQVELQGATGSDHGKGWSTRSRSTRDRMGFERFPAVLAGAGIGLLWGDASSFHGLVRIGALGSLAGSVALLLTHPKTK
ncbi:hypothetical protein, partial [Acidovorax sp. SUPP2825]|uniref:hypothetical protein n=1 Tax=Acidovorax sp. SUPP2825 TaxID=2920879 RepID=UPI0024E149E7